MTSGIIGVDFSEHQSRDLPFAEWFAQGLRFVIGRATIGYRQDAAYPYHLIAAKRAGFKCLGAYHVILRSDYDINYFDPVRQCEAFITRLIPGLTTLSALDIEARGLTEEMVRAWCDQYDAHCDLPLILYGNMALQALLGGNAGRYVKYCKWVSDYGFFAPGTQAPPLRSEPYDHPTVPRVPAVAGPMKIWQFAGDNGRRPPYPRAIDLNVFDGTDAALEAAFGLAPPVAAHPAVIRARGKIGPQLNIQGDADATDWLVRGQPSAALGINIGPPGEVTRPLFWVARNYETAWNPTEPARDGYSGAPIADARRYASIWYADWLRLNPWARLVATPNEPVVLTVEEMDYAAAFLAELVRIIHEEFNRTAVVGNWSVGSPDFPLWANYRPALVAVAKHGAILGRHSYGPLNEFYALRHRKDNEIFTAMGFPDLPVLLTECGWENIDGVDRAWANEPRRSAREYADYLVRLDDELMADPYVLGASVFTYGTNWSQHNLNGSGVGWLVADAQSRRPEFELAWPAPRPIVEEPEMDAAKIKQELVTIAAARGQVMEQLIVIAGAEAVIRAELATAAPISWWETWPAGVIAPPRKLAATGRTTVIYQADGVTPATAPRAQTGEWDVFARNGALLKVYDPAGDASDWWVRAADVVPK